MKEPGAAQVTVAEFRMFRQVKVSLGLGRARKFRWEKLSQRAGECRNVSVNTHTPTVYSRDAEPDNETCLQGR